MLFPTASTCSPSITFPTIHNIDKKGLEKFSECLKEAFENHYGYDESISLIDEQPSIHHNNNSDFHWSRYGPMKIIHHQQFEGLHQALKLIIA